MANKFGYSGQDGEDWFQAQAYQNNIIKNIKDPDGGQSQSMPCSIPSPFARMDLVRSAFEAINQTQALTAEKNATGVVIASTDHERLVSDALDLCELVFHKDTLNIPFEIIKWDKQQNIADLKASNDVSHKRYAETLELYLNQDADAFNFGKMNHLFLIKVNHKIIGATSPVTLFFTTGNSLNHAQQSFGSTDILFDNQYAPLYKRDKEFQKYLHLLFKDPTLSTNMPVMRDYLNENLKILNNENNVLYNELNTLVSNDINALYNDLDTSLNANDIVTVLGVNLKKIKSGQQTTEIAETCDFRINSIKGDSNQLPLVLQNNFSQPLNYVQGPWTNNAPVPYLDATTLSERYLPGHEQTIKYPYLTVSDFLEPNLIQLIYPTNNDQFYSGNKLDENPTEQGYILPLKKTFFEYFDTDDLISASANTPEITMKETNLADVTSVKVSLRIPIQNNNFILLERSYLSTSEKDEKNNKGGIVKQLFSMSIFPFVRTKQGSPSYRIQLLDNDKEGVDYALNFFEQANGSIINPKKSTTRTNKADIKGINSNYYVVEDNFDFIQINSAGASGMIIPKWKKRANGNESFSFAIDFGTSNTHIEYKTSENNQPKVFELDASENKHIATLHLRNKEGLRAISTKGLANSRLLDEFIDIEFIPEDISMDSNFIFPQRTVILEKKSIDTNTENNALADFNIPFLYGKRSLIEYGKLSTNLKWADNHSISKIRMEKFFEQLILMLKAKVLLNNGDLSKTKLTTFFPSSMSKARQADMRKNWEELFLNYFPNAEKPSQISESLAPFYHMRKSMTGGGYDKPVVGIDIGGGTTDVVVFKNGIPLKLSSFKFAGNALFGDGFKGNASSENRMLKKYTAHFNKLFESNKLDQLQKTLKNISESGSEDINAFLFSIHKNQKETKGQLFSYNELLSNDKEFKVLTLYFYSAIIYHIASIMNLNDIDPPKDIFFSGTASKILNIVTSDTKLLEDLSKIIFNKVYEHDKGSKLIITQPENPKELTSKGGLTIKDSEMTDDYASLKVIHHCVKGRDKITYNDIENNQLVGSISDEVKSFNNLFIALDKEIDFEDTFNVSQDSFKTFKKEINENVTAHIKHGIQYNRELDGIESDDKDASLSETCFFYPIIGYINEIRDELITDAE